MKDEPTITTSPLDTPEGQASIRMLHALQEFMEINGRHPGKGVELCLNYIVWRINGSPQSEAWKKREFKGMGEFFVRLSKEGKL